MAPILVFSAEEIWAHIPERPGKAESIHMTTLPTVHTEWKDDALQKNWEFLLNVRAEVTKALEAARARKLIGHPLDAALTLSVPEDKYTALASYAEELRSIFIVSQTALVQDEKFENAYVSEDVEGLQVLVERAAGDKCERCWVHDTTVGSFDDQPTICGRCKASLEKMGFNEK